MSHEFLDRYSRDTQSPIHGWDARVKLIVALAAVLLINFAPIHWPRGLSHLPVTWAQIVIAICLMGIIIAARIPWSYVLVRWAILAPFLLMLGLSIPLSHGFAGGWIEMGRAVMKALLSFTVVLVLINTTGFDQLLRAMRQLKVPALFVATLSSMYRYLFVLLDEQVRMRRARSARMCRAGRLADLKIAPGLIGMLLLRAFERSERVHAAMLARGYDGTVRALDHETQRLAPVFGRRSCRR